MTKLKSIFWQANQKRLRAGWRIILHAGLLSGLLVIPETIAGMIAFSLIISRGDLAADQLSDPAVVQSVVLDQPAVIMILYAAFIPVLVFSIWLAGRYLDRRSFRDFGFHFDRSWWIDLGFGFFLGAVLMGLIFLWEWRAGWVSVEGFLATQNPEASFWPTLIPPLLTYAGVAFSEELFSRGYHLKNLAEGFYGLSVAPRAAVLYAAVISSFLFGGLHILNPHASLVSTFNLSLAGLFLAAGYVLSGELALPIGLHFSWNFFQGNVFGFPVSGASLRSAALFEIRQLGPELWTGGRFGPEAGLLGVAAMVLGVILILVWERVRRGNVSLNIELAFPPGQESAGKKEADE